MKNNNDVEIGDGGVYCILKWPKIANVIKSGPGVKRLDQVGACLINSTIPRQSDNDGDGECVKFIQTHWADKRRKRNT